MAALMEEATSRLAEATLQQGQPPKDRVFYARHHVALKWVPYKPNSQEVKRGKMGRWQELRPYGIGWQNSEVVPEAGAWVEDVLNNPERDRRAHSEPRPVAGMRFYALPLAFHEPADDNGAAYVRDANGQAVAMMMWPGHTMEDTDAAVAETYALGRAFAATHSPAPTEALVAAMATAGGISSGPDGTGRMKVVVSGLEPGQEHKLHHLLSAAVPSTQGGAEG